MSLEDLVTGSLPDDLGEKKETSLFEAWESLYTPSTTFYLLQESLAEFPKGEWSRPLSEATLRLMRRRADNGRSGHNLLLHLLEAQNGGENDLGEAIARAMHLVEEDVIFQSQENTLRYAEEEWDTSAVEILARAAGVKEATARRWISGSNMSRRKYTSISMAVLLYREAIASGFTASSARVWILGSSDKPLETISQSRSGAFRWLPFEVRQMLKNQG